MNYLKATGIEGGLLINVGRSIRIKRRIMDKNELILAFFS